LVRALLQSGPAYLKSPASAARAWLVAIRSSVGQVARSFSPMRLKSHSRPRGDALSAIIEFDNVEQFIKGLRDHPEMALFRVIETGVEYHQLNQVDAEIAERETVTLRFFVLAKVEMLTGSVEMRQFCGDYSCRLHTPPPVPSAAEEIIWQLKELGAELELEVRHGYKPFGRIPAA
jgi:hypothetical protein